MKKIFLGACLWALVSAPALAQTGGSDVAVVRVERTGGPHGLITVSLGANSTQAKEIDVPNNSIKAAEALSEATQQALAPLVQQGYAVKAMSGGDFVTVIVLTKQK
jgi:hypothetical protein